MIIIVKGSLIKKRRYFIKLTLTNQTFVVLSFAECPLPFQSVLNELEL